MLSCFTEAVSAFHNVWIIGDIFVNDNFHVFPTIATRAQKNNKRKPYLYDNYNVKCYTTNSQSQTTQVPARIVNSVIKVLKD